MATALVCSLAHVAIFFRDWSPAWRMRNLTEHLAMAGWWFLLLVVAFTPLVLLVHGVVRRVGRVMRRRPPGPRRGVVNLGWALPAVAVPAVGVLVACIVLQGTASSVTAEPDRRLIAEAQAAVQPGLAFPATALPAVPGPDTTGRGERSLSPAQAAAAARASGTVLPASDGWQAVGSSQAQPRPDTVRPAGCQNQIAAAWQSERQRRRSATAVTVYALPADRLPPAGVELTVTVTSYTNPSDAAAALDDARATLRQCPEFDLASTQALGGWITTTQDRGPLPELDLPTVAGHRRGQWHRPRSDNPSQPIPLFSDVDYLTVQAGHAVVSTSLTVLHVAAPIGTGTATALRQILHAATVTAVNSLPRRQRTTTAVG
jgi:hypothetical protein